MKKILNFNIREITLIGIFGAVAALLMYLKFPLPLMPPFMEFDFSSVLELIGTFIMGPVAGAFIVIIKILIKLLLQGTSTMFVGELSNIIVSIAYVVPAGIIYKKMLNKKGAILGMLAGTILSTLMAALSNYFLILPLYANLFGMGMDDIVGMVTVVNPAVNSPFTLFLVGIIPFNIIKGGICAVVTFLIYKKIRATIENYAYKAKKC
ncbi:ECF transporter S component [Mycoplasma sp. P36-A1]|uniref:ECF transporter S component n=1 Tax=Mycoplasma sp. P36-A1 TaxID=3252900 RepID=UPI003C30816B